MDWVLVLLKTVDTFLKVLCDNDPAAEIVKKKNSRAVPKCVLD